MAIQQKTTINEVAAKTGLSKSTVSRALRGTGRISEATRARVFAAAKEMNYHPNPVARALNYDEIRVVLIVAPDIATPCQAETIEGCRERLYRYNYNTLVLDNSLFNQRTTDYLQVIKTQICNGVIFFFENAGDTMREVARLQPVVSYEFDPQDAGVHALLTDIPRCMEEVLGYLHKNFGHRRIALVNGRDSDPYARRFKEAYTAKMQALGLPVRPEYICGDRWGKKNGYDATQALLGLPQPPTAIVCVDSGMVQGGLVAAHDMGVSVPGQLSLFTLDGTRQNELLVPVIATANYSPADIGATLADMIYSQISGHAQGRQARTVQLSGIRTGGSVSDAKN